MTKSAVAPVASDFANEVSRRLERLVTLAADGGLDAAIGLMTRAIEAGAVIQAFGTGHSEAFAMEIAGRAGGLIPTNKIALRDLVLQGSLTDGRTWLGRASNATPTSLPSCGRSRRSILGTSSSSPPTPASTDQLWAWRCWPKRRAMTSSR